MAGGTKPLRKDLDSQDNETQEVQESEYQVLMESEEAGQGGLEEGTERQDAPGFMGTQEVLLV